LVIKSFVCLFHCSSFDIKIKPWKLEDTLLWSSSSVEK
jgi:hypothetical protein